jgi:hypothetical protein
MASQRMVTPADLRRAVAQARRMFEITSLVLGIGHVSA